MLRAQCVLQFVHQHPRCFGIISESRYLFLQIMFPVFWGLILILHLLSLLHLIQFLRLFVKKNDKVTPNFHKFIRFIEFFQLRLIIEHSDLMVPFDRIILCLLLLVMNKSSSSRNRMLSFFFGSSLCFTVSTEFNLRINPMAHCFGSSPNPFDRIQFGENIKIDPVRLPLSGSINSVSVDPAESIPF